MADGRKNNGGARPGAGRPSKAEELGLPKLIDECVSVEEQKDLIEAIYKRAVGGDFQHTKLFMEYKFGKPSQSVDLTTKGESFNEIRRVIVDPSNE